MCPAFKIPWEDNVSRIILLPKEVSDRIAAGEVVERPASIVKELLENSIDAGADDVAVELKDGGKTLIRVTDNGSGISGEDLRLAFMRHATSKISGFDDIQNIRSYGFRGEALSSIASVSRVEVITRMPDSHAGTRIVVENAEVIELGETGAPPGTSVAVSRLFAAVPARRKFLRSDSAEQGHCLEAITRIALARKELRVKVTANGKNALHIPRTENISERVALVLGADFARHCLPLRGERDGLRISGLVSQPGFTRANGKAIMFYVNGRFVRDTLLHHAVNSAYRKIIESGRYPLAVVFLELPPGEVDVNVHPAKTEVRFSNPSAVYEFLRASAIDSVSRILPGAQEHDRVYTLYRASSQEGGTGRGGAGAVQENGEIFHAPPRFSPRALEKMDLAGLMKAVEDKRLSQLEASPAGGRAGYFSSLQYIGQFAGTYLIFSGPDGLVMIDQHAAHERIVFEKLRAGARDRKLGSQSLLIPEVVNLSVHDTERVLSAAGALNAMGFEIEPFGEASVAVRSVPAIIGEINIADVVSNLAAHISETGKPAETEEWRDNIFAFLACRAAIKANREMSEQEIDALCRDLDSIPFASNCPHGRPVFVCFSRREIEKMFRRA